MNRVINLTFNSERLVMAVEVVASASANQAPASRVTGAVVIYAACIGDVLAISLTASRLVAN